MGAEALTEQAAAHTAAAQQQGTLRDGGGDENRATCANREVRAAAMALRVVEAPAHAHGACALEDHALDWRAGDHTAPAFDHLRKVGEVCALLVPTLAALQALSAARAVADVPTRERGLVAHLL